MQSIFEAALEQTVRSRTVSKTQMCYESVTKVSSQCSLVVAFHFIITQAVKCKWMWTLCVSLLQWQTSEDMANQ